jgi:hypothetical protein
VRESIDELENTASTGGETGISGVLEPALLPSAPSGDGPVEGRDPQSGRFLRGNHLGRGSPLAGQAAKLRAALFRAIKAGDVQDIVRALIGRAKTGDTVAARIVLAYLRQHGITLPQTETLSEGELTHDDS